MKLRLIGACAAMVGATLAGPGTAPLAAQDQPPEDIYLFADLSGAAETAGGDEDGYGDFAAKLKMTEGELCYELSVGNIEEPTAAHIHAGQAGTDGAPVITIAVTGTDEEACVAADAKLLKKIAGKPEDYYVNVHTADFPAGAVRGQIQA